MNWQDFEESVRQIASSHWSAPARAEEIAGVRCDAVIRVSPDEIIAIEITKEDNLGKLRTDLAKFASIRAALVPEGIVVRSFFVSAHEVSSLRVTGRAQKVEVLSVKEFREKFVGKEFMNMREKMSSSEVRSTQIPIKAIPAPLLRRVTSKNQQGKFTTSMKLRNYSQTEEKSFY